MTWSYGTKLGDTGEAECSACGSVWVHVYGRASHTCAACGQPLTCGVPSCQPPNPQPQPDCDRVWGQWPIVPASGRSTP